MRSIAIIPARSGSKGLKDKNIKHLCGKPLLAYTIECAIESCRFDKVFVSTDSHEYARIAEEYGDYDYNRGVFKYIAVMYPDEYYALPNYLTTYDLNKLFMEVKHDGIVFDEFAKHVMNAMEV